MEIELREETAEDVKFLEQLYVDVHAAEFAAVGLGADQLAGLMTMQARAQRMGYAAMYPGARRSVVWSGERPIGGMVVDDGGEVTTLVDVALLREFRGRGIGASLLAEVCRTAAEQGKAVRLSVKRGNRARNLYLRAGFRIYGEDAVQFEMEWARGSE